MNGQGRNYASNSSLWGPVMLIALGVLFLLSEFEVARFRETWPVLLVVVGILMLVPHAGRRRQSGSGNEVKHV